MWSRSALHDLRTSLIVLDHSSKIIPEAIAIASGPWSIRVQVGLGHHAVCWALEKERQVDTCIKLWKRFSGMSWQLKVVPCKESDFHLTPSDTG